MQLSPRGFSKCFRKKLLLDLYEEQGRKTCFNLSAGHCKLTRNGQILTSAWLAGSNSPSLHKAFEKKWKNSAYKVWRCQFPTPVTVDLLYQTMGRHCLESGYIKILKTAWEGKKIIVISNDTCKIPKLYNAKNIFLYTHTYIYIYSIHNCSNL